jgi:predicted dehydrogenase
MLAQEQLDGAVVVTSHASHYAVAKACLEAGLHVMIEKPMTLFARDAKALVDLAAARERELLVGYPFNYAPFVRYAKDVLDAGVLGEIEYIHCLYSSNVFELLRGNDAGVRGAVHGPGDVYSDPVRSGGGHGHLQITHGAGILFFVSGLRVGRVHALMHDRGLAVDVVDAATVQFENGALGTVGGTGNLGRGDGPKCDVQIYCRHGWVDIDAIAGTTEIHGDADALAPFTPTAPDPDREYRRFATAENLADVCLQRAPNGCPGEVGWRVVELLDAMYRSAQRDGAAVHVAELYEVTPSRSGL